VSERASTHFGTEPCWSLLCVTDLEMRMAAAPAWQTAFRDTPSAMPTANGTQYLAIEYAINGNNLL
jgi:hypothetical protein